MKGKPMLRDLLKRFRQKTPIPSEKLGVEELRNIYEILMILRKELVDSFDILKDRRMREVYDIFSFMMLHYDKMCQFLRRIVNAPLYYDSNQLKYSEIEELMMKLPLELSMKLRNLMNCIKTLKSYAHSAAPNYIRSLIFDIDGLIEDIAHDIGGVLR